MVDALLSDEPVQVTTIDEELVVASLRPQVRAAWRRLDFTSCTIVPLRARGETFGAGASVHFTRRLSLGRRQCRHERHQPRRLQRGRGLRACYAGRRPW